ncbi:MAG: undecaprenyldiphospho-muramoylpentapeptide beta-N-acetylglucosaminyltransferase [Myxococcota bacterium]
MTTPHAVPTKIVLAGGGTGGHVTPALAIADAIRAQYPATEILFVGTPQGLEATLVPRRGYRIELVAGSRLVGGGLGSKVKGLQSLAAGILAARRILAAERPNVVLGVGGYASGAALLAARSLGLPTAVHESNAVPGLTNRVLGALVDRVYLGFEAAARDFPQEVSLLSGNPVRAEIAAVGAGRQLPQGRRVRVLVVGGSQGSLFLNERVPHLLGLVAAAGVELEVRHQVGKLEAAPVEQRYAEAGLKVTVAGFIDDMAGAYAWADFAVTRSGSGTVSELAAAGLPALLVPFPHAAGDHQAANAKAFVDAGAGAWVRQAKWQAPDLAEWIVGLFGDPTVWQRTSDSARRLGARDAARAIALDCATWLEGGC